MPRKSLPTTEAGNRDDVYQRILKIQARNIVYFRTIQKELIDCVIINGDLSVTVKVHYYLNDDVIKDIKLCMVLY